MTKTKETPEARLLRRRIEATEKVCSALETALNLAYHRWSDIERGSPESQRTYDQMEEIDRMNFLWWLRLMVLERPDRKEHYRDLAKQMNVLEAFER